MGTGHLYWILTGPSFAVYRLSFGIIYTWALILIALSQAIQYRQDDHYEIQAGQLDEIK
jgi:hypothetical protein